MPRTNLVDHEKKVVISVNYKCASSSIIRWFRSNMKNYKHENTTISNIINRKYVFDDKHFDKYNNYYRVLIIRNPFNRVISAYLDKALHNFIPLNNLCKKHRTSIQALTFRKFVEILYLERNNKMNGHWAPLMDCNKPKKYNKIIKMEFLGKHMNSLAKKFNYNRFPAKKTIVKKQTVLLADVPAKKLKAMNKNDVKNYKNYFDKEIVQMVNEIYKDDLKTFKYTYEKFAAQ